MIVNPCDVIAHGLAYLPAKMDTRAARILLHAIGRQESRFEHRRQIGGPARGFWQFERGGGVTGVLRHQATRILAREACDALRVEPEPMAAWRALESNDNLAVVFARLLLWSDPSPLPPPTPANEQAAWDYYVRNWRPGKPHRSTWGRFWREALNAYAVETVA